MRNFRRLPPLLRVASIVGLLLPLATFALAIVSFVTGQSSSLHSYLDTSRLSLIALDLIWLSMACNLPVLAYNMHLLRPDRRPLRPFPLDSWQSQLRAILLLSVLPLCGIALALVIPTTSLAFGVAFLVSLLAAVVLLVAWTTAYAANSGPLRTPRAQ